MATKTKSFNELRERARRAIPNGAPTSPSTGARWKMRSR